LCYSVQNQAFYRTGIFGNFFFGGGGILRFQSGIPGGLAFKNYINKKSLHKTFSDTYG